MDFQGIYKTPRFPVISMDFHRLPWNKTLWSPKLHYMQRCDQSELTPGVVVAMIVTCLALAEPVSPPPPVLWPIRYGDVQYAGKPRDKKCGHIFRHLALCRQHCPELSVEEHAGKLDSHAPAGTRVGPRAASPPCRDMVQHSVLAK